MRSGGFFTLLFIFAALSLLLDLYAYSGLKSLTSAWKSPRRRKWANRSYLIFFIGVTVWFLLAILFTPNRRLTRFDEWALSVFLTCFITKVFFVLVLFLGDLGRILYGFIRRIARPKADRHTPFLPARRRFIVDSAILLASVPFTAFFYAMLKGKYDYRVHRVRLYFPDLPEAFDGFTITQLSDLHSGSFDHFAEVRRGIELAQAQRSDLFVFTGDLVNNIASEVEPYIDLFGQLKAPFGQFSILGNHDYGDYMRWDSPTEKDLNFESLKGQHKRLGYRLLLDEHVMIKKGSDQISLIGVQNWGRGFIQKGDLDKAIEGLSSDAFKILLSHDPTHWEEKVRFHPTKIHLTLSGHTHGAQFGIESDKIRWSPVQNRYLDWAGLANEKDRYLYVNRGFGFLAFSGRLGIWPEITVVTLKKQPV